MKYVLIIIGMLSVFIASAQEEAAVEPNMMGIQAGVYGVWIHREMRLAKSLALRAEVGVDIELGGGVNRVNFWGYPVVTIQPRWYYNLPKRVRKDKRIDANGGDFLALFFSSHPNWLVLTDANQGLSYAPDLSIMPTWGMRRSFAENMNFEFGIGLGKTFIFYEGQTDAINDAHITIRLGYTFQRK